jgi:3-oxoacid CoA-transferase subunit A
MAAQAMRFGSAKEAPIPIDRKLYKNALEATRDMYDGCSIMAGGFGLCGIPENLILATKLHGTKNLTVISNECGVSDFGLGILLKTK